MPQTDVSRIRRELTRCAREIEAMENQPPLLPALITTLGITDWERERQLILAELSTTRWPHEWRNTALYPERFGWPCHAAEGGPLTLICFFDGLSFVAPFSSVRPRVTHERNGANEN